MELNCKDMCVSGTQPHPEYHGWKNYLLEYCELRDERDGVKYFGSSNCNYLVFPTGDIVCNYGYHGRLLMNRVDSLGWKIVLNDILEQIRITKELLSE